MLLCLNWLFIADLLVSCWLFVCLVCNGFVFFVSCLCELVGFGGLLFVLGVYFGLFVLFSWIVLGSGVCWMVVLFGLC